MPSTPRRLQARLEAQGAWLGARTERIEGDTVNAPDATLLARQQLYRDMDPHHLTPLWEVLHALVPQKPATPCVPAHWKYDQVRPFLMRAGEAITARKPCAAC
jgi:gentisate 1,2-dioxygenase